MAKSKKSTAKQEIPKEKLLHMHKLMCNIRNFDEKVNYMVKRGQVPGMTHFSVGEEAANVGAIAALSEGDLITSNHRGHGQTIAMEIDLNEMMAEIMGKATGTCKGKGGSMHIADLDKGNLGANGIVGGGMGMAIGAALTQQMKKTGKIVMCCFGDGAVNEGTFHETMNMASIWKLPVIFYSINNFYGISTPISSVINIDYNYQRASAYGVPGHLIEDGNDLLAVYNKFVELVDYVRSGNGPVLVESLTYRWHGHSTSDPGKYRTKQEVDEWKKKDPIVKYKNHLIENKLASEEELDEIDRKSLDAVEASVKFAMESPEPTLESAFEDIFAD
ncbi:MAG: thiamine pyrophosphate-dependent dehydrogenase E1 component subunit alpha [Petrimonas sp.]|jgi:pyruvate dehydrogenase E1 component alpha subunit|uniref:thiamine pyrophosphate-dependent dehydrogenase E1 component subunit alpha n=1 Tax=Petrimonas sp. TaxID=2023866 RepID=UPI002B3A620B|nr:thiamine pyrophosphate-dependent dehydrogenase E1 component subunit alpha [Petrimonas sp.]MEA5042962.1 thiamine pyrophosphate-dependent dehydrogenase E1 component subunit alpha [Petrimonas sp.]HMM17052.1 thiamine pyrophosphate-dependent dehydrogenase E1 component subunit alpha [Petrimonas sp.]